MSEKKINPTLKMALELGPVVLFFIAYSKLKDQTFNILGQDYGGFIVVTAGFIPLLLIATAILWALSGKLSVMQILTAVLVIVFGGLSIYFNDERFFKMKPTIIYLLFGGILGYGLMRGKSYLQAVMGDAMPLTPQGWMILTKRFCIFFFSLAVANEIIWRTMTTDVWVNFKTFGLTAAIFVFFMFQGKLLSTHNSEPDKT